MAKMVIVGSNGFANEQELTEALPGCGVWRWNLARGHVHWSAPMYRLLGLEALKLARAAGDRYGEGGALNMRYRLHGDLAMQLVTAALTPAGQPGVAWWAHVGGFASGLALAPLMRSQRHQLRGR